MNRKPQTYIVILALIVFLLSAKVSFAAPSNGTKLPTKKRLEVGYEYSLMYKRPLDRSYGNLRAQSNFYTVSYGIFDWLCLDAKIGLGNVRQKGGIHLPKLEYRTGFAGGYGIRIRAFNHAKSGVSVILGAQHISIHPQDRSIDDDKYECFLDDWQISGIMSKRFKYITPYAGMKVSDCEIVYNINKHDKKRRYSKSHIGLICGADILLFEDKLRINLETRFIDETGLSTAIAYLF